MSAQGCSRYLPRKNSGELATGSSGRDRPSREVVQSLAFGSRSRSSLIFLCRIAAAARAIAAHKQNLFPSERGSSGCLGSTLHRGEFGCLYASCPAWGGGKSREYPRIEGILRDSDCGVTLTAAEILCLWFLRYSRVLPTTALVAQLILCRQSWGTIGKQPEMRAIRTWAYLQLYVRLQGSSKGVMVTRANVFKRGVYCSGMRQTTAHSSVSSPRLVAAFS